jgi:hypothetical protein
MLLSYQQRLADLTAPPGQATMAIRRAGVMATQHWEYEDDTYSVAARTDGDQVRLSIIFKKQKAPEALPERRMGRGQRVVVPAHEHMRRQGIQEDDMLVMVVDEHAGIYEVTSRTEPGAFHIVMVDEEGHETCQCTAGRYGRLCRHVKGVRVLRGLPLDTPLRSNNMNFDAEGNLLSFSLPFEPTD